MALTLMLAPVNSDVDLEQITAGLKYALEQQKLRVNIFEPIKEKLATAETTELDINKAEKLFAEKKFQDALDFIISEYNEIAKDVEVVVIKGVGIFPDRFYTPMLNRSIANALNAKVILVADAKHYHADTLRDQISIAANIFQPQSIDSRIMGCIIDNDIDVDEDMIKDIPVIACFPRHEKKYNFGEGVAQQVVTKWVKHFANQRFPKLISSAVFRHNIIEKARAANKKILLPEGNEPRIINAAMQSSKMRLGRCILLGKVSELKQIAKVNSIDWYDDVVVIDPDEIREKYVDDLVELRQHKGMTKELAVASLQNNTVLGTMMLQKGDVDGLVSGSVTTTADTIRPALQIIKTVPGINLVSSVFFICLPEQVMVYGDCAINPDPNAEELADIAIASADSAKSFGIDPKVAMISYSTGKSGSGASVDKVRAATEMVRKKRGDIAVYGPMQYDAAVVRSVAELKAPDSPVQGDANVFVFPNLDTGNTVSKAVQRTAGNVLAIGPMLQGLRKPVNDLSRGALVEDIVFTVALTAIQASTINS